MVETRSKKAQKGRTRSGKVFQESKREKKATKTNASRGAKPAIKVIVKKLQPEAISVGEIVYAKIAGFAPWPAFVKEIFFERKYIFLVEFFGDRTEGYIAVENLLKFCGNDAIAEKNKKRKGYAKALEEAKMMLKKA